MNDSAVAVSAIVMLGLILAAGLWQVLGIPRDHARRRHDDGTATAVDDLRRRVEELERRA